MFTLIVKLIKCLKRATTVILKKSELKNIKTYITDNNVDKYSYNGKIEAGPNSTQMAVLMK